MFGMKDMIAEETPFNDIKSIILERVKEMESEGETENVKAKPGMPIDLILPEELMNKFQAIAKKVYHAMCWAAATHPIYFR